MAEYMITVTKAKRQIKVTEEMVDRTFNEEVYQQIFEQGLTVVLNQGMSGLTKKYGPVKDLDEDELAEFQSEAFAIAEANLQRLLEGQVKRSRSKKASKEPRENIAEARRLARDAIKAGYRAAGKKTTGIKMSVLTAAADELIAEHPEYLEKARLNVAKKKEFESVVLEPTGKLAAMIADAEDAKPRVAPTRGRRKESATTEDIVAARATTQKGRVQPSARH